MIRLRETIEVARPIDEVFAYVSNFGNAAQWDPGVAESVKASSGPIGVGTAFNLRVRFGPLTDFTHSYTLFTAVNVRDTHIDGRAMWMRIISTVGFGPKHLRQIRGEPTSVASMASPRSIRVAAMAPNARSMAFCCSPFDPFAQQPAEER